MKKPMFDNRLSWGHILTALTMVLGIISAYAASRIDLARMEWKQDSQQRQIEQMTTAIVKLTENQSNGLRSLDRLTIIVDELTKHRAALNP